MTISIMEDIKPVSDLKRNAQIILEQARETKRPIVLTADGKADVVLIDAKTFEEHVKVSNLAKLLGEAEISLTEDRTRSARLFFKEFKHAKKIPR